jgi:hypothetical protein
MTNRYYDLLASIASTDEFIVQMFLFSVAAVLGYQTLGWLPAWLIRPMRYGYLASLLVLFFTTVFFSR